MTSTPSPAELFAEIERGDALRRLLELARAEDLATAGDVTTDSIVPPERQGAGDLVARRAGVVCGLRAVPAVLEAFDARASFETVAADGSACEAGARLGRITGALAGILHAERTLLNVVGRLSGIATLTRAFVDAVAGTRATVCATRKTTPGWRALEKYAVCCGGGSTHRMGLHDAALYKDNHLATLGAGSLGAGLADAIGRVRVRYGAALSFVEVEVDTLEQLREVLDLPAGLVDIVLLDNMAAAALREAVAIRDATARGVELEASGGVTRASLPEIAETGVDRISVGAITHAAPWLDVSLDVVGV